MDRCGPIKESSKDWEGDIISYGIIILSRV